MNSYSANILSLTGCLMLGGLASAQENGAPPATVDFQRIRPILSRHCFECHGPDARARQAGLRLDLPIEAGSADLPLVVPGDPEGSLIFQRITAADPDERMPPPDSGHVLDSDSIELIRRWIESGATWDRHWSFVPPRSITPPSVSDEAWCRDPVDRFILGSLEATGLAPAPEHPGEHLLRRVSLDLTGLPPTITELEAFNADPDPDRYERAVDRLLASPAYGERMATAWLDLARYADTHGYQSDVSRPTWPWRDWVIKAFNENLPHDDFITWQLAGDLLPDATREQKLATAFNRLHRQTNEGGSIEEEFRVEYVADRVSTYGTTMLGLTTDCARCHDHKFDPISQVEYYRLFAFFDDIDESGLYSHFTHATPTPALRLATPEQERSLEALELECDRLEQALEGRRIEVRNEFQAWLASEDTPLETPGLVGDYAFETVEAGALVNEADPGNPGTVTGPPEAVTGHRGMGLRMSGDDNARFPGVGAFDRNTPFTISLSIRITEPTDRNVILHRSRAWTDAGSQGYQLLLEDGRPSWSLIHFWPGNAISIRALDPLPVDAWARVTVSHDGSSRAEGLAIHVDGEPLEVEVVRDSLHRAITGGGPGAMTIGQRFRDRGFKNGMVDELKVFDRRLTPIEIRNLHDEAALETARRSASEELLPYFLANVDETYRTTLEALRTARTERSRLLDQVPEIMTMTELPEPRTSRVLERGRYDRPGQAVLPGVPERIMPLAETATADRMALAEWTTDPRNPLTARVAVNRLWAVLFGKGLVLTSEDLGSQGSTPTHPGLLDTLAVDYIESGWDTKSMLRRLALSSTYRQSARTSPETRRIDPENDLLSRGPSTRLTAEMLRDQALSASGLLVGTIGGPSVHPHQPAGLWKEKSEQVYPKSSGDGLHRRSMYTFWKRTSPPPAMMILDASKRDVCIARRGSTNTPLQALVLLNDPQFVEAARVLAERAIDEGGETAGSRIDFAFRSLTGRRPGPEEADVLLDLYRQEHAGLTPEEATLLAATGDAPRRDDLDPVQVAALTTVCSTILNSDAAVMKR